MIMGMEKTTRSAPPRGLLACVLVIVAALLASSCSDAYTEEQKLRAEGGTNPAILSVYASNRIVKTIDELTKLYELLNPGINFVVLTSETTLLTETVEAGARPAIWIDDDRAQQAFLELPDVAAEPRPIGFDVLQYITLPGNPKGLTGLRVFGPEASVKTSGLCQESQPCGAAAYEFLRSRNIEPDPDVIYGDGAALVRGVVREEIDAGMAYRTDAATRLGLTSRLPMPDPDAGRIDYQALQLVSNPNANAFLDWLTTSPDAIQILATSGLLPLGAGSR